MGMAGLAICIELTHYRFGLVREERQYIGRNGPQETDLESVGGPLFGIAGLAGDRGPAITTATRFAGGPEPRVVHGRLYDRLSIY